MENFEIIVGIHSIIFALLNPKRSGKRIVMTKEGESALKSHSKFRSELLNGVGIQKVNDQDFQKIGQKHFQELGHQYFRIPSKILLIVDPIEELALNEFYQQMKNKESLKMVAIDGITDVHNGAAIMRTSAFYDVDYFILTAKGNFGLTPSFYRISSGAADIIPIIKIKSLIPFIKKLGTLGVSCVGFAEKGLPSREIKTKILENKKNLLVMGSEDVGLSHAVLKFLPYVASLEGDSEFTTLNASVAATVAMERFFYRNNA